MCIRDSTKSQALAQTIDLAPTVLDYFDIPVPPDMQGRRLLDAMRGDDAIRSASLYGVMGGQVNVTDGRYVYMRGSATDDNGPLYEYTLMPTHMRSRFAPAELQDWQRSDGFGFTKDCKVMRIPTRTPKALLSGDTPMGRGRRSTLLFDVQADPGQLEPVTSTEIEARMIRLMLLEMARNECPPEQYERLGLPEPRRIGSGHDDTAIEMPSDEAIAAACVLASAEGLTAAEHGGEGQPKMPFPAWAQEAAFPDNLRLLPQYENPQSKS